MFLVMRTFSEPVCVLRTFREGSAKLLSEPFRELVLGVLRTCVVGSAATFREGVLGVQQKVSPRVQRFCLLCVAMVFIVCFGISAVGAESYLIYNELPRTSHSVDQARLRTETRVELTCREKLAGRL